MSTGSERLFASLHTEEDLRQLVGLPETAEFDCKLWGDRHDARRGSIAKAACGFANAEGGVIVLGVLASGRGPETPDVVRELRAIVKVKSALSEALDIVLNSVEPGVEGITTRIITSDNSVESGYALLHIPAQESAPRRTKTDWRFYVRVASGTLPMEYFQIEDRFGRRPHPRLVVTSQRSFQAGLGLTQSQRLIALSVKNEGRGLARFPALHCYKSKGIYFSLGAYGLNAPAWTFVDRDESRFSFRGGTNDVLYPGETLVIAVLQQNGTFINPPTRNQFGHTELSGPKSYEAITLKTEVVCEGMPAHAQEFSWPLETDAS